MTDSRPVFIAALPGVRVNTVAATNWERSIARFQPWGSQGDSALTHDLRKALETADIAVLACTCFPIVKDELESLFPSVVFLDPGAYCSSLLKEGYFSRNKRLKITATGMEVPLVEAADFAKRYLPNGSIICDDGSIARDAEPCLQTT